MPVTLEDRDAAAENAGCVEIGAQSVGDVAEVFADNCRAASMRATASIAAFGMET